jgi:hypothetical protein
MPDETKSASSGKGKVVLLFIVFHYGEWQASLLPA